MKQPREKLSIGKLLARTFGAITIILAVTAIWSYLGINTLLSTSEELIEANATDSHMSHLEADHMKWVQSLSFLFTDANVTEVTVQTDSSKCNLGKWYHSADRAELARLHPEVKEILDRIGPLHEQLHHSAVEIGSIYDHRDGASIAKAADIYSVKSIPSLTNLQELFDELRSTLSDHSITEEMLLEEASSQRSTIAIMATITVTLTIGIAILITRWVKANLAKSANSIQDVSFAVGGAAEQVASVSFAVADSSSKQAAALEETAAAMEEISSQTESNLDSARETGELAKVNLVAIENASENINGLNASIKSLFDNSKQIQTIVRSIDEIAFQTNILALNAAVEAARAGEAGAGFAVVADEVRALAQRAAASSQETATLIDSSVRHIDTSMSITNQCLEDFDRIQNTSRDVQNVIERVVSSSSEQAHGISQINQSVSSMDGIVQENASGAEESASAASEMKSLSAGLLSQVSDLLNFAGIESQRHEETKEGELMGSRLDRSTLEVPKSDPVWN